MHVIGTAGHIDHGKSALIRALTDIDPDRLQSEQERGMTIDLGFASLPLPSGREVGIVDVPGHQRFIENMLAGVGNIDMALFVVAANESWMPQTQQHMEILHLLGVRRGIVVLTKRDLVDDEWLELVRADVNERLAGTTLADAPMVAVSSKTGAGLPELVAHIDDMVAAAPTPTDYGRPRLWVDRVFSIRGAGTVATGTLQGGSLRVDDEVEIRPGGRRTRVRALQTHRRSVDEALPGSRVAVNLVGVETDDLGRGDALCAPPESPHAGGVGASRFVNVSLDLLPELPHPLNDMAELKLYVGSAAVSCRLRLLEGETAVAGASTLAQLWPERSLPVEFGDRFILRDATYQGTVGGGFILDPDAARVRVPSLRLVRDARFNARPTLPGMAREPRLDLAALALRRDIAAAGPEQYDRLLPAFVAERGVVAKAELAAAIPLSADALEQAVTRVEGARGSAAAAADHDATADPAAAIIDSGTYLLSAAVWNAFIDAVRTNLDAFHRRYPLRPGMGKETLRTTLGVERRLFEELLTLLTRRDHVVATGATLRTSEHEVVFTAEQEKIVAGVMEQLRDAPYAPPSLPELAAATAADDELLAALAARGDIVKVTDELAFAGDVVADVQARLVDHITVHGSADVGVLRDMLATSRKYALPLLEYFDQIGITRRVGDVRVLAASAREGSPSE